MPTFFFDNDISFRVAAALRELVHGAEIVALRDRFPVEAKDVEWIPEAGKQGWIVVSRDQNQRRREAEHRALSEYKVTVLYVRHSGTQNNLFLDAARIIKSWPKIQKWGESAKPGTLARLTTKDAIEEI